MLFNTKILNVFSAKRNKNVNTVSL